MKSADHTRRYTNAPDPGAGLDVRYEYDFGRRPGRARSSSSTSGRA